MNTSQSSHLMSHNYDPDSQVLTIQFHDGSIYQYAGVPLTEFHNFVQTGGSGTYFWTKIRDRYPTVKIAPGVRKR